MPTSSLNCRLINLALGLITRAVEVDYHANKTTISRNVGAVSQRDAVGDLAGFSRRRMGSMADQYDVIVIGAGLGGLTAAALIARSGRKTLLVERNESVGGAASTYRFGDLVVEASLHEQPALTRHMRSLERVLGVRLFQRDGRGIVLTNAGIVFRDRVRTVLRELDRAQLEVEALSRSPGGRIDFGLPLSISQAVTRVLVQHVHDELPGVALRVIDGWTGFIIEWLLRGRLDLGVIYDYTLKSDVLRTEPLASEEHFLVCAPGDKLAKRESITLAEVSQLLLALPSREH